MEVLVTEKNLLIKVRKIYFELSNLWEEIKSHEAKNESKLAETKVRRLERLIVVHLEPSEEELSEFGFAIEDGADGVNIYILSLLATRLVNTKFFNRVEEAIQCDAHYLTQKPLQLNLEIAVYAVKFGYAKAILEKVSNQEEIEYWNNIFEKYLVRFCQFDRLKVEEVKSASAPLASKIVNAFVPGIVGVLYYFKLCEDFTVLREISFDRSVIDLVKACQGYDESFRPLIKYFRAISIWSKTNDITKLEQLKREFIKCLVQDYGASSREIIEIKQALEQKVHIFELRCLVFLSSRHGNSVATIEV